METVVYKTVDGLDIRADVYPGDGGAAAPVLVWIHGGALIMGNRRCLHPALSALCSEAGYAHVSIDYRLAPETKLPAILEDVCDAFDWIRGPGAAQFGFDPARVAVVGHSGGGYLALMSGVHARPRPRVIASFYGYGNVDGPWYSEPDPYYCQSPAVSQDTAYEAVMGPPLSEDTGDKRRRFFYLYCRQNGFWPREVCGFDPEHDAGAFDPFCPVRNVTHDFPPTILLHGTKDTDVPYHLSADMAAALLAAGVPGVTLEEARGANPSAAAKAVARAAAFIIEHNRGG
ncbi:MAG: alpha/beta hydrolase [Candidatus Hydrogenedentes bacterium]|nr:alpha/beta hydrolase [Candidatus Hydrogenedentota bacterium]